MGRIHDLPRRWPDLPHQQRGRTRAAWFCNLGVILPMLGRRSKSIIAGIRISDAGFAARTAKNAPTVGSFISSSCLGMSLPLRPG
nr:hypothetical protein [Mesorhizobium sp.]